ncbi:MAG: DUF2231 domain-containing protein [Ignavibacteriaceae bacterium]
MELIKGIFKGRFLGHPIHLMIVHFPIAFFPMSAVLDLFSFFYEDKNLALFSFYAESAGVIFGWLALIFGTVDLLKISSKEKAFSVALIHGSLNLTWLIVFTVIAGIQIKFFPPIPVPGITVIVIKFIVVAGILFSNFLGGELLFKYEVVKKESSKKL